MDNRTENRSSCKDQTRNKTENRSSSSSQNSTASNEHKHPNQYTKGADDEGGKNTTHNSARNSRG